MAGYRVADGTQVNVDGVIYSGGELLPSVPDGQADLLLSVGIIVADTAPAKRRASKSTASD
jgi:hypothetical protein